MSERDRCFLLALAAVILAESTTGWILRDWPGSYGLFVANIVAALVLVWFALSIRPNGEKEL